MLNLRDYVNHNPDGKFQYYSQVLR